MARIMFPPEPKVLKFNMYIYLTQLSLFINQFSDAC